MSFKDFFKRKPKELAPEKGMSGDIAGDILGSSGVLSVGLGAASMGVGLTGVVSLPADVGLGLAFGGGAAAVAGGLVLHSAREVNRYEGKKSVDSQAKIPSDIKPFSQRQAEKRQNHDVVQSNPANTNLTNKIMDSKNNKSFEPTLGK